MNPTITIRPAALADLPEVVALWHEHQNYHACCDPWCENAKDADPGFLLHLQEHLAELGLFVAQADQRLVGFVLGEVVLRAPCFAVRQFGMISDLAVTEEWRSRSVGQRLLQEIMEWFRQKGIQRVETRVLLSNPLASRFWQKAGFKPYMQSVFMDK